MNHLNDQVLTNGPGELDPAMLESQLVALEDRLRELPESASDEQRAAITLPMARTLAALERGEQAWQIAHEAFGVFLAARRWEQAVEACDVLFLTNQDGSLSALGQGIWLAVTFPIDPELTVAMLHHVVEDTPDDSDGAAVAAAAAAYIVDLRTEGKQRDDLQFFTMQMLGAVARRHGEVESQQQFDYWMERLELHAPEKLLVRLRNVVDVLVQDDWWFDRDALQKDLPVN